MKSTISVVILIFLNILPINTFANGVGWTPGLAGTTPGPAKQKELYLEEEHVTMESDGVTARFHVLNPSSKDITTLMGFPLKASHSESDISYPHELDEDCKRIWLGYTNIEREIWVEVDGIEVPFTITCTSKGEYPAVINWNMTFPARKLTEFTVTYPLVAATTGMDNPGMGGKNLESWNYITHTGAFWSRPIGKATFEFCGLSAEVKCQDPIQGNVTKWSQDGIKAMSMEVGAIKPLHTSIDCEKNCIVWERENWVPQKGDDIKVVMTTETLDFGYYDGKNADKYFMKFWCGKEAPDIEGYCTEALRKSIWSFNETI